MSLPSIANSNGLSALREQIAAGQKFEGFVADLTDFDAPKLAGEVEKRFGRIDILINNAGIGQGQVRPDYHVNSPKFYEVTPSQWSRAIAVNASAVFLLSRAVVRPMLDRKWGRIINITTSLGTMLHGGWAPYGPSKASAEALSSVMAADLEGTGVTVNVVVPGGTVNTSMIPAEAPFARDELLQPEVMLRPLLWLVRLQQAVSDWRATGHQLGCETCFPMRRRRKAGAPIGWKDLAVLPIRPAF